MASEASSKKRRFRLFGKKKAKTAESSSGVPKAIASSPTARVSSSKGAPSSTLPPPVVRVDSPKASLQAKNKKKRVAPGKSSWLSRSKFFSKMSDSAFDMVDADGSGTVDEKELYSGLLLIHLKLGCYAGPAACRPVDRERVHTVFHKMDADKSGSLDREEFKEVMMVLCSNVLMRVVAQWSLTLIIVPLLAQKILDGIYFCNGKFWEFVMDLDEYSPVMDKVEVCIEQQRDWLLEQLPDVVFRVADKGKTVIDMVPDSVWNTIPLTILTCILGILVVPFVIFKIDDFFQSVAEEKKKSFEGDEGKED